MKNILLFLLSILCFSCSTLQDVDIENVNFSGEILQLEKRFSYIDSAFLSGNGNVNEAEALSADIENNLLNLNLQKASLSRLHALYGLTALSLGKKSEAKKALEASENAFKGDLFAFVLAHRLDSSKMVAQNFTYNEKSAEKGRIILEEALDLYRLKNYLEAVARFDSAFITLNSFYGDAYGEIRNQCWRLRSLSSENAGEDLLTLQQISVLQMLLITEKKSDLLYNFTGGRNLSSKELYAKVSGMGLLNPVSAALSVENSISSDYVVNKFIASRFLWNLYNANKNSQHLANKYSMRYGNAGKKSPVKDVELENPDFDAVLGCVEKEILNLEDGISFKGEKELSAVEFYDSLKKLQR